MLAGNTFATMRVLGAGQVPVGVVLRMLDGRPVLLFDDWVPESQS